MRRNHVGADVFTVDTVDGAVTVTGDLKVFGNTVFSDTQNYETTDNLIQLANGNDGDIRDIGLYGVYNDGSDHYAAIYREAKSARWKICTTDTEPNLTIGTSTLADFECAHVYGELKTASQPNITALAGLLSVSPSYNGYLYATSGVLSASSSIPYSAISGLSATGPITYSGGVIAFDYSLQNNLKLNNSYIYFKTGDNSNHYIKYDSTYDGVLLQGFASLSFNINGTIRAQVLDNGLYLPYTTADRYAYLNGSNVLVSRAAADWTSDVRAQFSAGSGIGLSGGVISVNSLSAFSTDDLKEGSSNLYFTTARARAAVTVSDPFIYSGGNLSLRYNTTNLRLSGGSVDTLNVIQDVNSTARPTFSGLILDNDGNSYGNIVCINTYNGNVAPSLTFTKSRAGATTSVNDSVLDIASNATFPASSSYTCFEMVTRVVDATNPTTSTEFYSLDNKSLVTVLGFSGSTVSLPTATASRFVRTDASKNLITTAVTTDDIAEGATNLYWTSSRFDTRLATKTTDNLTEGSTNLYHTNARARAALSVSAPLTYNSSTGAFGFGYNSTNLQLTASNLNTIQNIDTTATPSFFTVLLTSLSINTLCYLNSDNKLDSVVLQGTTNQVTVSGVGTAFITLSLPQSIATSSSPSFAGLSLTSNLQMKGNNIYLRDGDTSHGLIYDGTIDGPKIYGWAGTTFYTLSGGSTERFKITTAGPNIPTATASTYAYLDSSKNIVSRSAANFTSDVRAQFSAGTGIDITSGTIALDANLVSGTFAFSVTSELGFDTITDEFATYTRIGDIVTYNGRFNAVADGKFTTYFACEIDIPITNSGAWADNNAASGTMTGLHYRTTWTNPATFFSTGVTNKISFYVYPTVTPVIGDAVYFRWSLQYEVS